MREAGPADASGSAAAGAVEDGTRDAAPEAITTTGTGMVEEVEEAEKAPPPNVSQSTEVFEVQAVLDSVGMVERRLVPPAALVAGDELRYTIRLRNESAERIAPGRVQVQTPVPAGTRFLPGSAGGAGTLVEYTNDGQSFVPYVPGESAQPADVADAAADAPTGGEALATGSGTGNVGLANAAHDSPEPLTIRWTYQQPLEPGAVAEVYFHVRLL
jgi:uncharacterized repeat protein (TIGR01451 family)